jgi:hypothetical protein
LLRYNAVIAKSAIIRPPRTGRRQRNGWSSKSSATGAASIRRIKKLNKLMIDEFLIAANQQSQNQQSAIVLGA